MQKPKFLDSINGILTKIIPQGLREKVASFWNNKEIRNKVLFTLFMVVIYRVLAGVPLPGIDPNAFKDALSGTPFNNIFTAISGGRLDQPSLAAIGVGPYINASIVIQLLSTVIPKLEELTKQGDTGRRKLDQYTRWLTVPLAVLQSVMIYSILTNPDLAGSGANVLDSLSGVNLLAFLFSLTAGSLVLMWIGELISEHGIGNGASIIIAVGIIANIPSLVIGEIQGLEADWNMVLQGNIQSLFSNNFILFYLVIFAMIAMVVAVVFVTEAVRKIPVKYAKRFRQGNVAKNFLPLKLNQAGVMPVIFAQALLTFPQIVSSFIISIRDAGRLYDFASSILNSPFAQATSPQYIISFVVLIVGFTFFYTFVVIKPEQIANNLQKSGAFIPGIRPGKSTIDFLNYTTLKLTLFGAAFLAIIAIVPSLLTMIENTQSLTIFSGIGGTSLLIVVGVFMDAYRKMQSLESVQNYEMFM